MGKLPEIFDESVDKDGIHADVLLPKEKRTTGELTVKYLILGDEEREVKGSDWEAFSQWVDRLEWEEAKQLHSLTGEQIAEDWQGMLSEITEAQASETKSVDPVVLSVIETLVDFTKLGSRNDVLMIEASSAKGADNFGLRPEETALPPLLDDPNGMAFGDEEMKALTDVDNDETRRLAFLSAGTDAERALLKAKKTDGKNPKR